MRWGKRLGTYEENDQKTDGGNVYKQILMDAKLKTGKCCQKQSWVGEVRYGGEGPHWTALPSKKKKKK
jgi:hypothetical protein